MSVSQRVDAELTTGRSTNQILGLTAVAGGLGWLGTQFVDARPGAMLGLVGLEGTTVLVIGWSLLVAAVVAVGGYSASRAVRYSPPIWLWIGLVGIGLLVNAAVVVGLVPGARYALWHPWILIYAGGYLLTGIITIGRNRRAYLAGAVMAGLVFVVALRYPTATGGWLFIATGLIHAGPLAVDAVTSPARPMIANAPTGSEVETQ